MSCLLSLLFILFFNTSCASKHLPPGRAPAFAPSSSKKLCFEPFEIYFKLKADPKVIVEELLAHRQQNSLPVIVDIGGEGRYVGAININPQPLTSTTGAAGNIIPDWVPGLGSNLPLPAKIVDLLYLENAPINSQTMQEMLRVMRPRGQIHLSHPKDYADQYIDTLESYFGKDFIIRKDKNIISEIEVYIP